ncbi:hypothetical protein DL95DRAFT_399707 [Leptodontidium sp. 2 PMI_412]|nr:hypothetical protein DL95DRAFT_399707 [Leptodontidium sp. 2 PMI_412]
MALASTIDVTTPPIPSVAQPNTTPSPPLSSSTTSFDSERDRPARLERPKLTSPESSIIVPRDHPEIEIQEEEFPPDDARAMSPRRDSADVERLVQEARQALKEQAEISQSSLAVLAQQIDELKRGQDKLATENKSLRDCIGDLILENVREQTLIDNGIGQEKDIRKQIGGSYYTIGQST